MKYGLGLFLGSLLTCCRHIIVRKHLYWNCVQCGRVENVFVWSGFAGQYLMCHSCFMERLGYLPCSASTHDFCTNFVVEAAQPIRSLHVNKPTFVQAQSSSPSDWRRCEWTSTVQMACKNVNKLLKRLMGVAEVSVVVFFFPRKG